MVRWGDVVVGVDLRRCVADEEETGENDHGCAGLRRVQRVIEIQREVADRCPDQEADEHPGAAEHQAVATAIVLDHVQPRDGHDEVDGSEDDLRDVAVAQADGAEDRVAEVEDEVAAAELHQRLQRHAEERPVEHPRSGDDLRPGGCAGRFLVVELLLHVPHLLHDYLVVCGNTVQLAHNLARFFDSAVAVGVSRGLWEEESTDTEDQCPGKANAHGDTPGGSRLD